MSLLGFTISSDRNSELPGLSTRYHGSG
jgi:hypothetical protein